MLLANNKKFHWFPWMGLVKRSFILDNNIFYLKGRSYEDVLWTPHVFLKASPSTILIKKSTFIGWTSRSSKLQILPQNSKRYDLYLKLLV